MKTLGRALALMTMLASCVFAAPTLAFAADPIVYEVADDARLQSAVAAINRATGGDYVIELTDNFTSYGAYFSSACNTTILGNGYTITLGEGETSLSASNGAQLNLGSADGSDVLTISGGGEENNDIPGILRVGLGGTCNMYSGVTVCDRVGSNYPGGGVTVQGGTFHMYGGTIKNCGINGGGVCYGGGVGVVFDEYTGTTGGTFIMDGGEITGCSVIAPRPNNGWTFQSYGGGVFVGWGSSFTMNGGTISGNSADIGGGVALLDNSAEMNINGGSITGNKATICGGGLAAVGNDGAVVVNGTKLCNNVADGAASDVYLANTPAQLSSAGNMGERYLGSKPEDVTNKRIDGWYVDDDSSRYVEQPKDERQEYLGYAAIDSGDEVCLIAAGSGSLSEFHAKYEFQSATPGMSLPEDVLNLTPEDAKTYATNETLSAIAPAERVVEVTGGTWTFKGYDRESVLADATTADSEGNVTFVGVWEFTEKTGSSTGSGDGGQSGANGAANAGSSQGGTSSGLPQTGDVTSAAPYLALAASAASLLSALWLSRR